MEDQAERHSGCTRERARHTALRVRAGGGGGGNKRRSSDADDVDQRQQGQLLCHLVQRGRHVEQQQRHLAQRPALEQDEQLVPHQRHLQPRHTERDTQPRRRLHMPALPVGRHDRQRQLDRSR